MKRFFLTFLCAGLCLSLAAENLERETLETATEASTEAKAKNKTPKPKKEKKYDENGHIIKTGLNFGPLPAVAFDADKGFQLGAILNIYNYGDGSTYPNPLTKWYFEASFFTKGSQLYTIQYDDKKLIPGVRWSSTVTATIDKAFDFYGFNGYQSYYDFDRIAMGKANKKGQQDPNQFLFSPYYRTDKIYVYAKTDFIGKILPHFYWQAGYHFKYIRMTPINNEKINKSKDKKLNADGVAYNHYPEDHTTLFEQYKDWGLITPEELGKGGKGNTFSSAVRLGLMYDSRDKEGAPTRGIWAEAHIELAPKWIGNTVPYYRYGVKFRHYVPIVKRDVLTFAYRLNYEGTIGNFAPYYVLPFITVMGEDCDKDGMGSYRTCRGIMRTRVSGLDEATYTAEFRYRFVDFRLWNQNIAFALSLFSDGTMVTRRRSMEFNSPIDPLKNPIEYAAAAASYEAFKAGTSEAPLYKFTADQIAQRFEERQKHLDKDGWLKEVPHITFGVGLRFIMNENFIVAFEYGMPTSRFYRKTSPYYMQDGTGAFYINLGYLF